MNLLLPAAAFGAYLLYDLKSTGEKIQRCEISTYKLGKLSLGLQKCTIPVELQIYNPNGSDVPAEYFRGIVKNAGKKIGEFSFDAKGKSVMLKKHANTPLVFNVSITTLGIISKLVSVFANIFSAKPLDTTFTIEGVITISGIDVPVNFSWDAKENKEVKAVSGISGLKDFSYRITDSKKALDILDNGLVNKGQIHKHPANDKHKSFCVVRFYYKRGGSAETHEISNKTFNDLLNTGRFENTTNK